MEPVPPAVFDSGLIGLSTLNRAFGIACCRQFVHDRLVREAFSAAFDST